MENSADPDQTPLSMASDLGLYIVGANTYGKYG